MLIEQRLLGCIESTLTLDLSEVERSQEEVDGLDHEVRHRIADARVCGHCEIRRATRRLSLPKSRFSLKSLHLHSRDV